MKAVILAGGKGKRMHSDLPKVLFEINGQSLIAHVVQNAREAGIDDIAVVTGYKGDMVREALGEGISYYRQAEQLGTADALKSARDFFAHEDPPVIVLCGDAPLVDSDSILQLASYYEKHSLDMCVLTATLEDPANYGRILRDGKNFERIVESRDANEEQLAIKEINSGTMIFNSGKLAQVLDEIKNDNAQGEYYLTDAVEIFKAKGFKTGALCIANADIVLGANDRYDLSLCEKAMRKSINRALMLGGVRMIDPDTTYIDRNVRIGAGSVIYPNTIINGKSCIGENNTVISSRLTDCVIGDDNTVDNSVLEQCRIGSETSIGPYSHIRRDTVLASKTKVGSFAETKNADIGEGTKVPHLSYVGDATVGERCNFGCGSVVANYDGENKYHTNIGNDVFIGCNVNMIAPIDIRDGAFIAAGSTVSKNIEKDAFIIERAKPVQLDKALLKKKK